MLKKILPLFMTAAGIQAEQLSITAWLSRNDWAAGVDSVRQHSQLLNEVSPAWYSLAENGEIELRDGDASDPALLDFTREKNILLRPLLSNVSAQGMGGALLRATLADSSLRSRHAQAIRRLVLDNGLDGIDLDYEGLSAGELGLLADLVELAAEALHASGKSLAVTLQPLNGMAALAAWRRIGAAADSVRLMLYDQHTSSGQPGPTASKDWMVERLALLVTAVPTEKIWVGLATFANQWQPGANRSGTWRSLAEPILREKDKLTRDPDSGSVRYQAGDKIIWFEDARSIKAKADIASAFGIRRFAFWRLGGEDPNIWKVLREWKPLPGR